MNHEKILGHRSILTTAKYTHLTTHTGNNARQLINELINGFSIQWGDVKCSDCHQLSRLSTRSLGRQCQARRLR